MSTFIITKNPEEIFAALQVILPDPRFAVLFRWMSERIHGEVDSKRMAEDLCLGLAFAAEPEKLYPPRWVSSIQIHWLKLLIESIILDYRMRGIQTSSELVEQIGLKLPLLISVFVADVYLNLEVTADILRILGWAEEQIKAWKDPIETDLRSMENN